MLRGNRRDGQATGGIGVTQPDDVEEELLFRGRLDHLVVLEPTPGEDSRAERASRGHGRHAEDSDATEKGRCEAPHARAGIVPAHAGEEVLTIPRSACIRASAAFVMVLAALNFKARAEAS